MFSASALLLLRQNASVIKPYLFSELHVQLKATEHFKTMSMLLFY